MTTFRLNRLGAFALAIALLFVGLTGSIARAGTTGSITGTITDTTTKKPLANVRVHAASPSQSQSTATNAQGFFVLQNLLPDTYTVSAEISGYQVAVQEGLTVQQDINIPLNLALASALKTIGRVTANSGSLLKPTQTTDVYNVTGAQLNAASGGDNLHKTLYEYVATAPGVTSNGFPGLPRIRGGAATDTGYEFDGIPVRERITGLFTSNLSNIGFQNVEVYTGGLTAQNAGNGTGVINSVVKQGTSPSFGVISLGATFPDFNHYATFEYGNATPNNRFSYYFALDAVNSNNTYDNGANTFPNVLYEGYNGPGTVITRDLIANFHFRPSEKDDIQFLLQNGNGEFNYTYLLGGGTHLSLVPCVGAVTASTTSPTGFSGGTAPNGTPCPAGLAFGSLDANQGNNWHHYSGIGKLQWNHLINDHSAFTARLAENFNQYIFDQPLSDPNYAADNSNSPGPGCPTYPLAAGTPVAVVAGNLCSQQIEVFYGDRRSNMYFGSLDYTNTPNANVTVKVGIGQEYDVNAEAYYNTNGFNGDGSYPQHGTTSIYPTHFPYVYGDLTLNTGRLTLEPGLRYQRGYYAFPGSKVVSILSPTVGATYRFNPNNVVRASYGNTSNFIGTVYVYRQFSTTYNPQAKGGSYDPQVNHSADLMFEHQFDANTSIRVGPYVRRSTNYYSLYKPYLGLSNTGKPTYGPTIPTNAGSNNVFGAEFGLSHIDNRSSGASAFLSGTYQNYWTTSFKSSVTGVYNQSQLPANLAASGFRLRATGNPLFDGTATLDLHSGVYSLLPLVYYQVGTFYNVGPGGNESIAQANWKVNATLLRRFGQPGNKSSALGLRVTNLTNNKKDTAPCISDGTGCDPYNGPQSGVTTAKGATIYQNYTQDPRRYEVFLTTRF